MIKKEKNLEKIIKNLNLKVTDETINSFFENHPSYPSFASISDAFNLWGIPNTVIGITEENLNEIDLPAIAYMVHNESDEYYVIIKRIENGIIEFFDSELGLTKNTIQEFLIEWRGMVLLFEENQESGEPNFIKIKKESRHRKIEKSIICSTLIIVSLIVLEILIFKSIILESIFNFLSALGLAFSLMLITIEYTLDLNLSRKLCNTTESFSCSTLVKDRKAKLFDWISYAEIGVIYFSSLLLSGLFNNKALIYFISLFSMAFIPYSLYYQGIVTKVWCKLCLYVQAILLFQGILSIKLSFQMAPIQNDLYIILNTVLYFTITASLWFLIKRQIIDLQKLKKEKKLLNKLRFEPNFFVLWLNRQDEISFEYTKNEIMFGNKQSPNNLILVLNPLCSSCLEVLQIGLRYVKIYRDDLNLIIRLIGETKHHFMVITHLLANSDNYDLENILLLNFKNKDLNTFMKSYNLENSEKTKQTYLEHEKWANENNINNTPSVFLNRKRIQGPFEIEDLAYYLQVFFEEDKEVA